MSFTRITITILFVFSYWWAPLAHADSLLKTAEGLHQSGKTSEAYELLIKEVGTNAGEPAFDLLLGIVALDVGKPTQAVFALERVLAVEPDNNRARAELARAYFEMGENEAAKEEFTTLKSTSTPTAVSQTINKYLSEIESRLSSGKSFSRLYVEAAMGFDSNVNSATDSSTIAIPAFGNLLFTLNNSARELDSGFFSLGAGASFSAPLPKWENWRISGGANFTERYTFNETDFRTRIANGRVGLGYTRDKNTWRASLQGQKYYLDNDENRDLGGVNLQWLHSYNDRTQFSTFLQVSAQRFPNQTVRNVNQITGGLGVVHLFAANGEPVLFASVFAGTDEELDDIREYVGKAFVGIRAGGEYTLNPKTKLVGNFSYQYSRYGGEEPLFREKRKDHFVFIRAGVEYALSEKLLLRPEIQYLTNDSSLIINEFDRWQPFVTMRYTF